MGGTRLRPRREIAEIVLPTTSLWHGLLRSVRPSMVSIGVQPQTRNPPVCALCNSAPVCVICVCKRERDRLAMHCARFGLVRSWPRPDTL